MKITKAANKYFFFNVAFVLTTGCLNPLNCFSQDDFTFINHKDSVLSYNYACQNPAIIYEASFTNRLPININKLISGMKNLRKISFNNINGISFDTIRIERLSKLFSLEFKYCLIEKIPNNVKNITHLSIHGSSISFINFSELKGLSRLKYLQLYDNKKLVNISFKKSKLLQLENLQVTISKCKRIEGLSRSCPRLQWLEINISEMESVPADFAKLKHLSYLSIAESKIQDLDSILFIISRSNIKKLKLINRYFTDEKKNILKEKCKLRNIELVL